ncbi:MlaA family lipoprotein [Stenotrophomonas sp. SY1]|uniref:MlaA family lipoprotein n=1 Tax=Stenotrophomonas sp. SY1 TaxID=477235 RepID=UPI001E2E73AB|nr:MlaA family lipoprotein [Stenotrophomonas sp. SY1]MCD9085165.1 VacJ family lipoprotein [Stenotrophomonas sp. SY1]
MSLIRSLPLLVALALLSACAGKPARDSAPPTATVVAPSSTDATLDVSVTAADAKPTSTAASDTAQADTDDNVVAQDGSTGTPTPTTAEDDFAALYGGPVAANNGDTGNDAPPSYDPWEKYNRGVHRFNNAVDRAVARPLATAYTNVVPQFARTGVTNFFSNLRSPLTMVNQLLQGHADDAWDTLGRFLMNSTFGIGGLFDPASKAMVPKRSEDFGQTLGAWGWRQSRYVELPFFGPRTVRDVFGLAGDIPLSPVRQIEMDKVRIGLQGLQLVDMRAQLLSIDSLRDGAVDEYSLTRDAWLQRRSYQIQKDLRRDRKHDDDEQQTIPVDAMPMPDFGG